MLKYMSNTVTDVKNPVQKQQNNYLWDIVGSSQTNNCYR